MRLAIGFSDKKNFMPMSWLIKKFLKTDYSHVYFRISIAHHQVVFESMAYGFRAIHFNTFLADNRVVKEYFIDITETETNRLMDYFWRNMGLKYSFANVLGNAVNMVTGFKAFKDGMNKMMCSEMIFRAPLEIFCECKEPDFVTPKDIELHLEAYDGNKSSDKHHGHAD